MSKFNINFRGVYFVNLSSKPIKKILLSLSILLLTLMFTTNTLAASGDKNKMLVLTM